MILKKVPPFPAAPSGTRKLKDPVSPKIDLR